MNNMIKKINLLFLLLLATAQAYAISNVELDLDFTPNMNSQLDDALAQVRSIAIQDDGKILIGGTALGPIGEQRSRLVRLTVDGQLDSEFAVVSVDNLVSAIAVQADGKIILAGDFSDINIDGESTERNGIARLNSDGSLDMEFNPNVTSSGSSNRGNIRALALDSDDRILIGGFFNLVGSQSRNFLARLDSEGNLDDDFNLNFNINDNDDGLSVRAIAIDSDNKIVIGGRFNNMGNIERDEVARLDSDGSLDISFNSPTISGRGEFVRSLAIQQDNKVLIGGSFDNVAGAERDSIARLNTNGSLDTSFNPPNISGSPIRSILVQSDFQILIGGLIQLDGSTVARLNADGSLDPRFDISVSNDVFAMAQQASDNSILIGGGFATINGIARSRLARINFLPELSFTTPTISQAEGDTEGVIFEFEVSRSMLNDEDSSVTYTLSGGANNPATADDFVSNELAQGTLTFTDGVSRQTISVAVLGDTLTELDETFTITLSNPVNAILNTSVAQGTILNDDITVDTGFNPTADNSIFSILAQADGSILVGGTFANIGGESRNRVARFNPDDSLDSMFNPPTDSVDGSVFAMLVQGDGKIVLAGNFTTFGGSTRNAIARIHADGSFDETFNPNVTGSTITIDALALQIIDGEEKILIGGEFSAVGDVSRNNMARLNLDGSLDDSLNDSFDPNVDNRVRSIVVDNQNRILLSGSFNNVGSTTNTTTRHITRLNADGSLDDNFNSPFTSAMDGNNTIFSIAIQADERIVIGGDFSSVGGVPRQLVARLNADGSLDTSFIPADIPDDGTVRAVVIQTNGQILIGGFFSDVDGVAMTANLARLNTDGSLDITLTPNVNDTVFTIAQQATSGDILIGGTFTSVGGTVRDRIASIENPVPTFDFSPTSLSQVEGNSGEIIYQFEVLRTRVFNGVASFDYSVSGGGDNPANADDFINSELAQDTLTFDDDQTSQTISITVRGDTRIEDDETFIVTLSNPSNAVFNTSVAQGVIVNDDSEICLPITASNGGIAVVCL